MKNKLNIAAQALNSTNAKSLIIHSTSLGEYLMNMKGTPRENCSQKHVKALLETIMKVIRNYPSVPQLKENYYLLKKMLLSFRKVISTETKLGKINQIVRRLGEVDLPNYSCLCCSQVFYYKWKLPKEESQERFKIILTTKKEIESEGYVQKLICAGLNNNSPTIILTGIQNSSNTVVGDIISQKRKEMIEQIVGRGKRYVNLKEKREEIKVDFVPVLKDPFDQNSKEKKEISGCYVVRIKMYSTETDIPYYVNAERKGYHSLYETFFQKDNSHSVNQAFELDIYSLFQGKGRTPKRNCFHHPFRQCLNPL